MKGGNCLSGSFYSLFRCVFTGKTTTAIVFLIFSFSQPLFIKQCTHRPQLDAESNLKLVKVSGV